MYNENVEILQVNLEILQKSIKKLDKLDSKEYFKSIAEIDQLVSEV